jgi:hypothetical protein
MRKLSQSGHPGLRLFVSRLEMILGTLLLGLATLLLHLETRRVGRGASSEQALGLLAALTASALAMVISIGGPEDLTLESKQAFSSKDSPLRVRGNKYHG